MQNKLNYSAVLRPSVSIISLLLSPPMQYLSLLLIGDEKNQACSERSQTESCFLSDAKYMRCHVGHRWLHYIMTKKSALLWKHFNTQ